MIKLKIVPHNNEFNRWNLYHLDEDTGEIELWDSQLQPVEKDEEDARKLDVDTGMEIA